LFDLPLIAPKSEELAEQAEEIHELFAYFIYCAIGLHFIGAAKHHLLDKDETVRRMGGNTVFLLLGALLLLGVALFIANDVLGESDEHDHAEHSHEEPESYNEKKANPEKVVSEENAQIDSTEEVPLWIINPDESFIRFKFQQYGQDVQGEFDKFKGRIEFDSEDLAASQVDIMIDATSISTGSEDRDEQAKSDAWFDVDEFPLAVFKSESFAEVGPNQYTTRGNLTIRGHTMPIVLPFSLEIAEKEGGSKQAQMLSQITLMRLDFGIGQGEWESEDEIGNEVMVDILVTATQAP